MKTKFRLLIPLMFMLSVVFIPSVSSQKDSRFNTIEEIKADPGSFIDEAVTIKGFITQYNAASAKTTAFYLVKGEYGEVITVNTRLVKPKIQRKYKIKGIVKLDDYNSPYLVEISKIMIWPVWVIAVVSIIVLLVVLIIFILVRGKAKNVSIEKPKKSEKSEEPRYDDEFKTVQVTKDKPITLIHIPAKLVIVGGEDDSKEIGLQGMPFKDGGKVTIGSREESGDAKATHIRLMDPTISRSQAEIILLDKEKKIVVKNLSKTNYTQVNGEELLPDSVKELQSGDLISMGSLEFKFVS